MQSGRKRTETFPKIQMNIHPSFRNAYYQECGEEYLCSL